MTFFGNLKHKKKKKFKCTWNIMELRLHFESKLKLIQWLDEKDWIKSMCMKYIMYIFSTTIGLHVCDSWHITKPNKNEKIIQCSLIKFSPFS
jgi:hypothetical protein